MRLLVTGATGFLGWRTAMVLTERGHDVLGIARPGRAARAHASELPCPVREMDAGDPAAAGPVRRHHATAAEDATDGGARGLLVAAAPAGPRGAVR